jgi:hypothetical protein
VGIRQQASNNAVKAVNEIQTTREGNPTDERTQEKQRHTNVQPSI